MRKNAEPAVTGLNNVCGPCCSHLSTILNNIAEPGDNEAHQGVMTDRRHSLKRGYRLSKNEQQMTASDWKSDKLRFVLWVKSDSDIYYNETSDKAATK
jgi:hypothetical protein